MKKKIRMLDKNNPLLRVLIIGVLLIGAALMPIGYSTGALKADSQPMAGAQPVYCGVTASADGHAALTASGNLGNASAYDVCEAPNSDVANSDLSASPVYDNYIMYDAGSLWATWSTSDDCIMVVSVMDAETNGGAGGYGDYVTASRHTFVAAGTETFPGCTLMPMPVVTEGTSTGTYIEIQWTALDNANLGTSESSSIVDSYKIYRSTDNVTFTELADSGAHVSASTMTYQDTTAAAGVTYYYRIGVNFVSSTTSFTAWVRSFGSAPVVLQDTAPPTITHTPETSATDGESITINATITDDSGTVTGASVFYRVAGTENYVGEPMIYVSGDDYTFDIPALAVTTAGVEYYISATDGTNTATHPATNPETSPHSITVSATNQAPVLSWTGETGYTDDGLDPETGTAGVTNFIYQVKYVDVDNNPPASGYPKVHILKGGTEITGSPFTMNAVDASDTTYSDGKMYTYTTTLASAGTDYTYYFNATDGTDWATGTPTGVVEQAPDVSVAGEDTEPPVIIHTPVIDATEGEKITINATITDINLTAASVFYRKIGTGNYVAEAMICILSDGVPTNNYTFDIPASAVTTAGVEYYIWASDGVNNATDGPHSISVSAAQPTTGSISGTVTYKNGNPMSGVTVTAGGSSDTTDANGDYTISDLSAGAYTVTAEKSGYKSSTQSKTVTAGDEIVADFTLEKKEVSKPGFIPGIGIIGTTLALLGAALIIWKKRKVEE